MKGVGHWCIGESTYAFKGYEENSLNWKSQIEEGEPRKLLFCWRNLQIGPLTWRINHFLLQFFTISQKSLCTCTSLCWLGEYTMEPKLISIRILIWIYIREFQIIDCIFKSCLLFENFKGQFTTRFPIKHNLLVHSSWGQILFNCNPIYFKNELYPQKFKKISRQI